MKAPSPPSRRVANPPRQPVRPGKPPQPEVKAPKNVVQSYLPGEYEPPTIRMPPKPSIEAVVDLAKKGPVDLPSACAKLGITPDALLERVETSVKAGYPVKILHGYLTWRLPEPTDSAQDTGIAPVIG